MSSISELNKRQISRFNNKIKLRESVLQGGFSLIELMVAIVIGLFITMGLSEIFLNMYVTSQSQRALTQFQENQRLSLVILMNTVQLAGHFSDTALSITQNVTSLPAVTNNVGTYKDNTTFIAGAGIVGTGSNAITGSGSDTLDIYYQTSGTDGILNCQGGSATSTTRYVNSFSIQNNNLICSLASIPTGSSTLKAVGDVVLANNVQSMTILYGIDTTGTANSTDAYYTADAVTNAGKWLNVRSVQITLNFYKPNVNNAVIPTNGSTYSATTATVPWVQTINVMSKI